MCPKQLVAYAQTSNGLLSEEGSLTNQKQEQRSLAWCKGKLLTNFIGNPQMVVGKNHCFQGNLTIDKGKSANAALELKLLKKGKPSNDCPSYAIHVKR